MVSCVKGTMIACNSILCTLGLSVGISAVVFYFKPYLLQNTGLPQYEGALILGMVFGFTIFFISFFGLIGAGAESSCLLITYIVLVVLTMIVSMAACGFSFYVAVAVAGKEAIKNGITTAFKESIANPEKGTRSEDLKKVQDEFDCCGCYNESDYKDPKASQCDPKFRNVGCCKKLADKIYDAVHPLLLGLACGILVAVLIEIMAIIFACVMVSNVRGSHSSGGGSNTRMQMRVAGHV